MPQGLHIKWYDCFLSIWHHLFRLLKLCLYRWCQVMVLLELVSRLPTQRSGHFYRTSMWIFADVNFPPLENKHSCFLPATAGELTVYYISIVGGGASTYGWGRIMSSQISLSPTSLPLLFILDLALFVFSCSPSEILPISFGDQYDLLSRIPS